MMACYNNYFINSVITSDDVTKQTYTRSTPDNECDLRPRDGGSTEKGLATFMA